MAVVFRMDDVHPRIHIRLHEPEFDVHVCGYVLDDERLGRRHLVPIDPHVDEPVSVGEGQGKRYRRPGDHRYGPSGGQRTPFVRLGDIPDTAGDDDTHYFRYRDVYFDLNVVGGCLAEIDEYIAVPVHEHIQVVGKADRFPVDRYAVDDVSVIRRDPHIRHGSEGIRIFVRYGPVAGSLDTQRTGTVRTVVPCKSQDGGHRHDAYD